jgi:hypothetical protein
VVNVWRGNACRMEGSAYVGDTLAAEALVTCRMVDRARAEKRPSQEKIET